LLFDLDNATLESLPQVEGLEEGSAAKVVLGQSFLGAYVDHAREHGEPVCPSMLRYPTRILRAWF
jgi:hypothetical protein